MQRDHLYIKALRIIQRQGSADKSTIAANLNISMMTVNKIVNDLLERSIIKKSGKYEGKGGRKSYLLTLNSDLFIAIGISVDEENIIIAAVKPDGSVISHSKYSNGIREWFRNAESIVEAIVEHYKLFIKTSGFNREMIAAVGIAPHGIIDTKNGRCIMGTHIGGIVDLNLRDALSRILNIPVFVDDPARSLTYYEKKYGAGRDVDNFIYLFIDLGVGSGVVINGDIYLGASGMSGEVGHIKVDDNGVRCKCGNYGCLETVASIENIIRQFREGIGAGVLTRLVDLCEGNIDRIDLDVISNAAESDDKFTLSVLESVGSKLGRALSVVITLFNPELVLIGGRVAMLTPYILEPIQREIKYRALNPMNKQVPIMAVEYSEVKNCVSVAVEAFDALFQDDDFVRGMRNTCFQHTYRRG